jgi:hypothetical protein
MTISETAEIIAEILHGIQFGTRTEGTHWRRLKPPVSFDPQGTMVSRV